jgi:hypothetical protein
VEGDVHILRLADHGGVDLGVGESAPAVEHVESDDVAAELLLVEVALFAQTEEADEEGAREPAGVGGADAGREHRVLDGLVALKIQAAHHPPGVLGLERRR